MIKVGNNSFRHTQFSPKASETISQRRFLPKLKVCPSSVSSTNPLAQNSKLKNNALDNTSLLLMNRRYNLLFYSQFSCAIARFLFSNISGFFCLAFSMYFLSSEDGLSDLSMSIGSTRNNNDSLRTRDRTTYSQFLNISKSSSWPGWYNNYIFWHSLQFVSGCCIIDICWNLYHSTTKFNFFD